MVFKVNYNKETVPNTAFNIFIWNKLKRALYPVYEGLGDIPLDGLFASYPSIEAKHYHYPIIF